MSNVHPIPPSSTSTDVLPLTWIEALFDRMSLSYGRKFTEQWDGIDPKKLKDHWAQELACMSRAELSRGYKALATRDWPPTLPEFKKLCRPEMSIDAAVAEAIEQIVLRTRGQDSWSHPAIYWAAQKVGYYELTTLTHAQVKVRFAPILDSILAKGNVPPVPARQFQIEGQAKDQAAPLSEENRAQLRQSLRSFIDKANGKTDHRAWAKRIQDREAAGDELLTPLQMRMAREALAQPEFVG